MQAARGASLRSDRAEATTPSRRRHTVLLLAVAVLAVIADQITKQLAVHHLADGREHRFVGSLLQLHLTYNAGAAFSTGTRYTLLISCLAIAAVAVVLWVSRRVRTGWWAVTLGILLGGIAGNLVDRLVREPAPMRGHVVDFLELPHWPIFNIADVCINIGAVLILLLALVGMRLDGTRGADG